MILGSQIQRLRFSDLNFDWFLFFKKICSFFELKLVRFTALGPSWVIFGSHPGTQRRLGVVLSKYSRYFSKAGTSNFGFALSLLCQAMID